MIEEYVLNLVDWIYSLPVVSIYLIFLAISYTENVFPPIPGDLLIVFGGYIAVENVVSFNALLWITTFGSVLGFMTIYYIGYRLGDEIRTRNPRLGFLKYFDRKYLDKAELWMYRWGQGVILANRFLAGTRSIISLTAGISRTKTTRTVISATVSALLWNLILLTVGWYIGENWQVIKNYLNIYGTTILVLIILFVGIKMFLKYRKRKKNSKLIEDSVDKTDL
jgi:membrane protein DedA with SNARE-associated domain